MDILDEDHVVYLVLCSLNELRCIFNINIDRYTLNSFLRGKKNILYNKCITSNTSCIGVLSCISITIIDKLIDNLIKEKLLEIYSNDEVQKNKKHC